MAVTLKIKPSSGTLEESKNLEFELSGLDRSKELRVSFENATLGVFARPHSLKFSSLGPKPNYDTNRYAPIPQMPPVVDSAFSGRLDLNASPDSDSNVITIFANVEEKNGNDWYLRDIAAFAFQVENRIADAGGSKVRVEPAFVSSGERSTIAVENDPHTIVRVIINGKQFLVRTGQSGQGSISFRAIDILAGSPKGAGALQRFPVYYSRSDENFDKIYDSGVAVHYIPSSMKVLQAATGDFAAPECAVFDLEPGPGQRLRTLDDFCFTGAVVGEFSIFDSASGYNDSRSGFCGTINEGVIESASSEGVCRIYNSSSSTVLPNGTGLIAFSSAYDPSAEAGYANERCPVQTLAGRVFIAHVPSSLKYRGNPVRDGSILKPPGFYHTVYFNDVVEGDLIGVEFRLQNGDLFEIQVTATASSDGTATDFANLVRADSRIDDAGIEILRRGSELDFYSDNRFVVRSIVREEFTSSVDTCLNTNKTLRILTSTTAVADQGGTVVFLHSELGSQSYTIADRLDRVIWIEMPDGVNNNIGPTVEENIYCQQFVIIDTSSSPASEGLTEINPLPYIKDRFQREIPATYPAIASRKDYVDGMTYVYIVCQAPISDGSYQLYFYSFRLGDSIDKETEWKQLTTDGENKNAVIRCDGGGNLHVVWESDRSGTTQVYYGVLGPGSNIINNQILMSVIDRETESSLSLLSISDPVAHPSTSWSRFESSLGGVSLVSDSEIAIEANPSDDGAMAVFAMTDDPNSFVFDGLFSQMSFQISFDLNVLDVVSEVWDDRRIEKEFKSWLDQFTPIGENRYQLDLNRFSLDKVEPYYDRIIPIAGSYKLDVSSLSDVSGGTDATGYDHNGDATYFDLSDPATLSHASNLKHFVLALMPEKVRFKAVNLDPLFTYCRDNDMSIGSCSGYTDQIEEVHYTGRYKLAILLSTSENESTGQVAKKKHTVIRQFGDAIDFDGGSKNIKIVVHYSKASSDFISNVLTTDTQANSQDYRFYGDIVVTVDDVAKLGQSFVADFSDQYREFDIGLGIPSSGKYLVNEILPYNGNLYDDKQLRLHYSNVAVGKPSVEVNDSYISFSERDRSTSQMVVSGDGSVNLLLNGDFETSHVPLQDELVLDDGSTSITGWTAYNGVVYRLNNETSPEFQSYSGDYMIEVGGTSPSLLASIETTITTTPGKYYVLKFAVSPHPNGAKELAAEVERSFVITAGSTSGGGSITQAVDESGMNWQIQSLRFYASSSSSLIRFEAAAGGSTYGLMFDDMRVYAVDDIMDELSSDSAAESLLLSDDEFNLSYSLKTSNGLSQIPITFSDTDQNRNPDLCIDKFNKPHVVWQSNRNGPWEVYYSGARYRSFPFRFETRITDSSSSAIEPSVAVDPKGRRMVSWQDNRNGGWQVYAAVSTQIDEQWYDQCKYDEADQYVWEVEQIDPYDPYARNTDFVGCSINFDFSVPASGKYHFAAEFYTDRERTKLFKKVSSQTDIAGWRVDDLQIDSGGTTLVGGTSVVVSYSVAKEDALSGKVYYVTLKYEGELNAIGIDMDSGSSTSNINLISLSDLSGLDVSLGEYENDSSFTVFKEFEGEATIARSKQTVTDINDSPGSYPTYAGAVFEGSLDSLPGFSVGDRIASYYVHFDTVTESSTTLEATIVFNDAIAAVIFASSDLAETDDALGFAAVTYDSSGAAGRGASFNPDSSDAITISEDRKTITINLTIAANDWSNLRIVTTPTYAQDGNADFVFYCAAEQSSRCDVNVQYANDSDADQHVSFRITFYADPNRESAVLSSFTALDVNGWSSGASGFPSGGLLVAAKDVVSINFDPNILPFNLYDVQDTVDGVRKQSLLCGVPYYVVVESYTSGGFREIDSFTLTCPCAYTEPSIWREDADSPLWSCSGQGGSDKRISMTSRDTLRPQLVSAENNLIYAVWEDYRYAGLTTGQPIVSPDYFFAVWDSENNEIHSSGQGGFDRRITYYSDEGHSILYDHSVFIDPFQNLNTAFHDGVKMYSRSCSIGCAFEAFNEAVRPCMFTDGTDTDFYQIGSSPERNVEQYMKIRLVSKYIAFSTYLDIDSPLPVINDCFVEMDIVGVPGTYAYRLKNESDEEWTEWLPIGPSLPEQATDTASTAVERDFFRARFIGKDRFVAPWVVSPKNGTKRVCCEVLTFFGKTEQFCLDFMALYREMEYSIDFFYDAAFASPAPKYKHMTVVSTKKTTTPIDESNLISIGENTTSVDTIYVRVTFKDVEKINLLRKMAAMERFDYFGEMTIDVYQQGLNDQTGLSLTKVSDGIYRGSFSVAEDDTVTNVDGLAVVLVNVPGNCKPTSYDSVSQRLNSLLTNSSLDQSVEVFNDMTIFRDKYISDDVRNSFGDPGYYKTRNFGSSGNKVGGNDKWTGGGG